MAKQSAPSMEVVPVLSAAEIAAKSEVCWGCGFLRPIEELAAISDEEKAGEMHCLRCRTDGPPKPCEIAWEDVPPKHRKLLQGIFVEGRAASELCRSLGITSDRTLANVLENDATRRAYQALLRERGLDAVYLSSKLRVLACAQKPLWNNATGSWDFFPDYTTQMKAIDLLHRLHDYVPRNERSERPETSQRTIVILHNLDAKPIAIEAHQGTFIANPTRETVLPEETPACGS